MQRLIKKNQPKKGFVCIVCDYFYIPEEIPDVSRVTRDTIEFYRKDWECPECGAGRSCVREIRLNVEDDECE
jgi:rubredoxin